MKKYFPIKIFSIKYAYGWWWGSYFFFFGKHSTNRYEQFRIHPPMYATRHPEGSCEGIFRAYD